MKQLPNEAFLDDAGQLYIQRPVPASSFDPPGSPDKYAYQATGFTFDNVPTYGWPLGVIWDNNPLQFASEATAARLLGICSDVFPSYRFRISLDEVKVGPYQRAAIRQIAVSDEGGLIVKLNAGEMANQAARDKDGWTVRVLRSIKQAEARRDTELGQ